MNAQDSSSAEVRHIAAEKTRRLVLACAAVGVLGIILAFASSFLASHGFKHFLYSYLLNFCYFLSLSLGALFFVLLHHVTRAGWSVVVRRMAEVMASTIPFWALLFLPILLLILSGDGNLYEWNGEEARNDELIQKKVAYLNAPFFAIPYVQLRGIPALRYQGDTAGAIEVEARYNIAPRWAGIAFLGSGFVHSDDPLFEEPDDIYGTGFGVRYQLFYRSERVGRAGYGVGA